MHQNRIQNRVQAQCTAASLNNAHGLSKKSHARTFTRAISADLTIVQPSMYIHLHMLEAKNVANSCVSQVAWPFAVLKFQDRMMNMEYRADRKMPSTARCLVARPSAYLLSWCSTLPLGGSTAQQTHVCIQDHCKPFAKAAKGLG